MRGLKAFIVTLVMIALIFGVYTIFSLHKQRSTDKNHVMIYLIESTPTDFYLIPVQRQIEGPPSPASAVQALLSGPLAHEELFASVPQSTKLLGLTIRDTLATANFSPEITNDFGGGSLMEAHLVEAIVKTLTEFPDIERVQILVDGEVIESIGGHILITQPLRRSN